jgi:hypothetical protein
VAPPAEPAAEAAPPTVEPPTVEPPTVEPPTVEPPARARRIAIDIDDDYFPARRPAGPDRPDGAVEPPAPAPAPPAPADSSAVPVWAVRAPTPAPEFAPAGPQFSSDLSLDPMALRPKVTIRSGASSVQVDQHRLRLRTWMRRSSIDWSDVAGFEAQAETVDDGFEDRPTGAGHLLALTSAGPVPLPGTRRPMAELRYVHALLDAYRIRARRLANG